MSVEVEILDGKSHLADRLRTDLAAASSAKVAVAFAMESGLREVPLEDWCRSGRRLELIAGTDFALTELELLRRMEATANADCRVYHSLANQTFHPKMYLLDQGSRQVAYVGSSNFTAGGLRGNVEANVRLEAPTGTPELARATSYFRRLFDGEFATPVDPEFARRYEELQNARRLALRGMEAGGTERRTREIERIIVGAHRSAVAAKRWLLVVTPENYALCMRHLTWGHQRESEARGYTPGDVFVFHVTGGRGVAAMGMFTGAPYYDDAPLWQRMEKGAFPWRISFVPLGEIRTGISTKEVLVARRPGAPKNWFHGFIQASHSLDHPDFEALRSAFESALRLEAGLGLGS